MFEKGQGNIIFDEVIKCCSYQEDAEVRTTAFMCITEIVESYFRYCEPFMAKITEVTVATLDTDPEEDVRKQALEVWIALASEEIFKTKQGEMSTSLIAPFADPLLEPLLKNLISVEADEEVFDSSLMTPSEYAAKALQGLSQCLQGAWNEKICSFCIEKLSSSQAWNDKYCSLLALGALFEH